MTCALSFQVTYDFEYVNPDPSLLKDGCGFFAPKVTKIKTTTTATATTTTTTTDNKDNNKS